MKFFKIHLLIITLALCIPNLQAQQWQVLNSANTGLPLEKVSYMDLDTAGHPIFTLRDSGFAFFDGVTWSYIPGPFPRHHDVVEQDLNGHLWTSYSFPDFVPRKLARYDGSGWIIYDSTTVPLLSGSQFIDDIEMDPSGKLWFAGDDGFLLTYDGSSWYRYSDTTHYYFGTRDFDDI